MLHKRQKHHQAEVQEYRQALELANLAETNRRILLETPIEHNVCMLQHVEVKDVYVVIGRFLANKDIAVLLRTSKYMNFVAAGLTLFDPVVLDSPAISTDPSVLDKLLSMKMKVFQIKTQFILDASEDQLQQLTTRSCPPNECVQLTLPSRTDDKKYLVFYDEDNYDGNFHEVVGEGEEWLVPFAKVSFISQWLTNNICSSLTSLDMGSFDYSPDNAAAWSEFNTAFRSNTHIVKLKILGRPDWFNLLLDRQTLLTDLEVSIPTTWTNNAPHWTGAHSTWTVKMLVLLLAKVLERYTSTLKRLSLYYGEGFYGDHHYVVPSNIDRLACAMAGLSVLEHLEYTFDIQTNFIGHCWFSQSMLPSAQFKQSLKTLKVSLPYLDKNFTDFLPNCANLQTLNVSTINDELVHDDGFEYEAHYPAFASFVTQTTSLRHLVIRYNRHSDEDMARLLNAIMSNCSLVKVVFGNVEYRKIITVPELRQMTIRLHEQRQFNGQPFFIDRLGFHHLSEEGWHENETLQLLRKTMQCQFPQEAGLYQNL